MSSSSYELILTNSPDGPITVYETTTGTVVARFSGSRSPCRGLTVVGRRLFAASHVSSDTGAGSINIYNWFNSTAFHNFPVPEPVAPLIATHDGTFLFGGGISGSLFSISTHSGDVIRSIAAHSRSVSSLHLSDDGSLVISGSDDGTIVVVPTFKIVIIRASLDEDMEDLILHKWKAHSDSVTAFKSVMGTLLSCSLDCTCKFWNLGDNGVLLRIVAFPCAIFGIALDSKGLGFYVAGADGLVYKGAMKAGSRKLLSRVCELSTWSKSHGRSIVSLALVNEGRNLVSAAEDGSVWMWDVDKGEVVMDMGNEVVMVNISDMVVARGNGEFGVRKGNNVAIEEGNGSFTSYGLCDEEMIKTLEQITKLGEVRGEVEQHKKKVIGMLESTIEMYERFLKLILKEATKAIEEGGVEDDKDEE
ncbi:hypothetical protein JHK82_048705 [Glycine max]|nr:hypothetical protein JHK82_048705 [Glycine max]